MGYRVAAIDRTATIDEAALLKDRGQKIRIDRRARDMGFGLPSNPRGNGAGSAPRRRFGATRRSRTTAVAASARADVVAAGLTRSPPRSSSMRAPEERRSSGTFCNAAGQLLRSGAGTRFRAPTLRCSLGKEERRPSREERPAGRERNRLGRAGRIIATPVRLPARVSRIRVISRFVPLVDLVLLVSAFFGSSLWKFISRRSLR